MKMTDLAGRNIKISAATIVVLNDAGKTAGMIKGVETYYNIRASYGMRGADETKLWKATKNSFDNDVRMQMGNKFLKQLFKSGGEWFYIIDEKEIAHINSWIEEYPNAVERGAINPRTVEFLEKQEQAAIDFGATIIRASIIKDSRNI